jgi:hypothetical protein
MGGGWSSTPAGDVVTVTQRGCDLAATDAAQQWLGAAGAFYDQWNVNMVFEYGGANLSLTGHLNRSRGRPGAVKRPPRSPIELHFVCGFCVGAQGVFKTAESGGSRPWQMQPAAVPAGQHHHVLEQRDMGEAVIRRSVHCGTYVLYICRRVSLVWC